MSRANPRVWCATAPRLSVPIRATRLGTSASNRAAGGIPDGFPEFCVAFSHSWSTPRSLKCWEVGEMPPESIATRVPRKRRAQLGRHCGDEIPREIREIPAVFRPEIGRHGHAPGRPLFKTTPFFQNGFARIANRDANSPGNTCRTAWAGRARRTACPTRGALVLTKGARGPTRRVRRARKGETRLRVCAFFDRAPQAPARPGRGRSWPGPSGRCGRSVRPVNGRRRTGWAARGGSSRPSGPPP